MPHQVWHVLLYLVVLSYPCMFARRGRTNLAVMLVLADLIIVCGHVLLDPDVRIVSIAFLTSIVFASSLCVSLDSGRLERFFLGQLRKPAAKILLTLLAVLFIPLGSLELACRACTALGILKYHQAIQTVWRSGHDDWRLATITGDDNREPDPVLLWRPVARKPFNSDRFKGPEIVDPKPADTFRVICYGDSLTDGPPKGGWPRWLETILQKQPAIPGRRFEVLNAGVAGYSSYQGLLRFLQEVDHYQPDLLLVSFGWNDAAEAIGQPDKTFQPPPRLIVACQRALVRYRAYLVLMYYTRQWRTQPPKSPSGLSHPRVSVDDYLANMDRFRAEAQSRGIPIAFITRPHKLSASQLERDPTWRGSVPKYNAALREWSAQRDLPLIDLQRAFESLPTDLFSDECHFHPAGYEKMAELVQARLVPGPHAALAVGKTPTPRQ